MEEDSSEKELGFSLLVETSFKASENTPLLPTFATRVPPSYMSTATTV